MMWPYTGRKTFTSNMEVFGTPSFTSTGRGNLDKEYYKKFAYPGRGQVSFSLNHIGDDGRVYKCYGLSNSDITEQLTEKLGGNNVRPKSFKPSKQLHEKNVNQLKMMLTMPEKERKVSLTHVTEAIMRNEIVPSEMRLQNDAFLSDYMRTTNSKLPPLRRKSLLLAKDIEGNLRVNVRLNRKPSRQRAPLVKYHEEKPAEEEGDLILPAITVDTGKTHTDGSVKHNADGIMKKHQFRGAMSLRRRSSIKRLFRIKDKDGEKQTNSPTVFYDKPLSTQMERKDSVTRTTEAISEQFRAAIQAGTADQANDLNVSGKNSHDTLTKQLRTGSGKSKTNGYKLRHEYGKNLEKNWFKNYMMKQSKSKTKSCDTNQDSNELRLDIFYSPEPESDSEMNDTEDNDNEYLADASLQCGGYSTATAEFRAREKLSQKDRRISNLPAEAIMEEEELFDSNADSSESDIEIVLKENQLIQRKTKHKMRKKRHRQLQRYKTFMSYEKPAVPEVAEKEVDVPLTDQEIRALRLNLRNKERLKKLKGKRKFLQVANAVYIVAQFKKILNNIRKRKRNVIKKRQQRIAAMVAKRVNQKDGKEEEQVDEENKQPTPKPSLKEQFMSEVGHKLLYDLEKLNIYSESETEADDECESEPETERSKDVGTSQSKENPYSKVMKRDTASKFAAEIKKISLEDVRVSHRKTFISSRLFKRRNTLPRLGRPFEFVVEVPCKPKRKAIKGKKDGFSRYSRRPPSPEIKCSCYVHNKLLARSQSSASRQPTKCQHQAEVKKPKMKKIRVPTRGLFRTQSLDNLAKYRPIELHDLLKDIDIPAKEIKLQILARKFRRQRRRRQRVKLSPCRLPDVSREDTRKESDSGSEEAESDDSDKSDYDFVYGAPFVGCGVMWHKDSRARRRRTWSEEDVEREVKKITKVFHELKECRYLRLDSFNSAIMAKLNEKKLLM